MRGVGKFNLNGACCGGRESGFEVSRCGDRRCVPRAADRPCFLVAELPGALPATLHCGRSSRSFVFQPQGKLPPNPQRACANSRCLPRTDGVLQALLDRAESISPNGWVPTEDSVLFHLQQLLVYLLPLFLPCALLKCPFLRPRSLWRRQMRSPSCVGSQDGAAEKGRRVSERIRQKELS